MERELAIQALHTEIENLTRLHIQYGLHNTEGFTVQKQCIEKLIQDHRINLKVELDPLALNLYRRYFG